RLLIRPGRDRDPGRVEHASRRAHAGAIDVVQPLARAGVIPGDEVVGPVEGESRIVLLSGRGRDRDSGGVEHGPGRGYARAVDVGVRARAEVRPGYEVVRAVEGERGASLGAARNGRDRKLGIEHGPPGADAGAVDVIWARAQLLPDD